MSMIATEVLVSVGLKVLRGDKVSTPCVPEQDTAIKLIHIKTKLFAKIIFISLLNTLEYF
ncbi:MAG: hypothetical protein Fur0022_26670 [Anaerolineales bacterium]